MKKLILKSVLWLSTFSLAYLVLICFATYLPNDETNYVRYVTKSVRHEGGWGHTLTRFREIGELDSVDILFAGSSHSYRGFDTRNFPEVKSFNMGTHSQTPLATHYLLKEYVPKLKPKLVIIETYFVIFCNGDLETLYDLTMNLPFSFSKFQLLWDAGESRAVHQFFSTMFRRLKYPYDGLKQQKIKKETYIPGGFVHSHREFKEKNETYPLLAPREKSFLFLEKSIALVEKAGAKVVLVQAPLSAKHTRGEKYYESVDKRLRQIARDAQVIYLNLRYDPSYSLEQNHYLDEDHLSAKGAKLFNFDLKARLKAFGVYPTQEIDRSLAGS